MFRLRADLDVERADLLPRERDREARPLPGHHLGDVGEGDRRAPDDAVAAGVGEDDAAVGDVRRRGRSARRPHHAANFENVAEVRAKGEFERDDRAARGEIGEGDAFVQAAVMDEPLPLDMDHALGQGLLAERRQRAIRHMRREQHVVAAQMRGEQGGAFAAEGDAQAGQDARIAVKEPVAVADDVAVRIGDDERVGAFQRIELRRRPRFAARNIGRKGGEVAGNLRRGGRDRGVVPPDHI